MSTEKDAQTTTSVRLREALDTKGLKIKDAAETCGIPYRSFQNYTLGLREPNAEAFRLICTHLGVSLDWLLAGEGSMHRGEGGGSAVVSRSETPREAALLDNYRELDDSTQVEILSAAILRRRVGALERQLQELQTVVASLIRSP